MPIGEIKPFAGADHADFFFYGAPRAALLIHGFFGTPAEMRPLGIVLNHAGWSVKGIFLPGFGRDSGALEGREVRLREPRAR